MLHIVKQFMFGLTVGIKSDFEQTGNSQEVSTEIDVNVQKDKITSLLSQLNTVNDDILDSNDNVYNVDNQVNAELATVLVNL
jgi:hypothetical protein